MKFSLIILLAILSCIPIAKNISFKKMCSLVKLKILTILNGKKSPSNNH